MGDFSFLDIVGYIMLKLAWIIPACVMIFVAYVIFKSRQTDARDAYIKANGVSLDAKIIEVVYDEIQRINNYLVAVVTIKYLYQGQNVVSKRGLSFLLTDKDKIIAGNIIKIKVNPHKPDSFYYVGYRNY